MKRKSCVRGFVLLCSVFLLLSACTDKSGAGNIKTVSAVIPPSEAYETAEAFTMGGGYEKWKEGNRAYQDASSAVQPEIQDFYRAVLTELLTKEENTVISPVNIYMALSMMAEITDGDTRGEILKLLNADSTETVRDRIDAIYMAHYSDNPLLTEKMASSLWLRNDISYRDKSLHILAEKYHASFFCGKMGSPEMNRALQNWTNDNTGKLLAESVKDMRTEEDTVLKMVSTIYMKAIWMVPFDKTQTKRESFHGIHGEQECDMMHMSESRSYYWGEKFGAITQTLSEGGTVFLILPEEGTAPKDLLQEEELYQCLNDDSYEKRKFLKVHASVPKFSVSSKTDLTEALKTFGIEKVFHGGDFSPLTTDTDVFLNKAEHAAILEADEEGITGAAYTDLGFAGAAMPPEEEMDFVLDRPFLVFVKGNDGSLIFAAAVYEV